MQLPRPSSLPRPPKPSELPPPPGPFRPTFWRSPLRGPWLTSILGSMLLALIIVVALTGLISHSAYEPSLIKGFNATTPPSEDVGPLITLPASFPSWSYAVTQGLHITFGLIAIPLLLAKLWSVIPRLFTWPPTEGPSKGLERIAILLLVGSALLEFVTGVLDIQVFYPWHYSFYAAHYYGAWIFICSLALHVAVKFPTIRGAYRTRGALAPLRTSLAETAPEPYVEGGLAPPSPAAPTISRRGLFGLVGAGSLALLVANVGESIGGPLRATALLAPRGRSFGSGPNAFAVNKTAASLNVTHLALDPDWKLAVQGTRQLSFTREQLMAMPQHTYAMPIACVEGWSTTQHWTGVRLRDLRAMAGASPHAILEARSLQPAGPYRQVAFSAGQVDGEAALLALRVNGADLSPDHGYPARIIMPVLPGVHAMKWVASLRFVEL